MRSALPPLVSSFDIRYVVVGSRSLHRQHKFRLVLYELLSSVQDRQVIDYHNFIEKSTILGFYVSSSIARRLGVACHIDIFDKQPLPFGLIRYGVAPDHPEVKNCIHQFEQLVDRSDGRVRLFCNVSVGTDVTIGELREHYNVIVLAYGAENERRLGELICFDLVSIIFQV